MAIISQLHITALLSWGKELSAFVRVRTSVDAVAKEMLLLFLACSI
jgi:hypothetical protein